MKVIVKKDGHHFCTHVNQVAIDPAKPRPDNQKDFTGNDPDRDADIREGGMFT